MLPPLCVQALGFPTISIIAFWGWTVVCGGGRPAHRGVPGNVPGLHPLEAGNHPSAHCNNERGLQTSPSVLWGETHAPLETAVSLHKFYLDLMGRNKKGQKKISHIT